MSPRPKTLVFIGLAAGLLVPAFLPIDGAAVGALNRAVTPASAALLRFLDAALPALLLATGTIAGGALLFFGGSAVTRRAGIVLALAPFLATGVTGILKALVERPRPQHQEHGLEGLTLLVRLAGRDGFPSGHVTTATAFAVAMLFVLPAVRARFAVLLLVPLMMWSRIALAVHFPSDTLAGVTVGVLAVAAVAALLSRVDPVVAPRFRFQAAAGFLLVLTAAFPAARYPVDPVSLEPVSEVKLHPRFARTLFEPFAGPALEVAYAPGVKDFLIALAPWVSLVLLLSVLLPPLRGMGENLRRGGACALYLALILLLAWSGRLPADRFVVAPNVGILFDPHVHAGDPVDGTGEASELVARQRERGIDLSAITLHDAPPSVIEGLPGCEWSGRRHPDQPSIHLLVFGGEGAIPSVIDVVVPPLEATGTAGIGRVLDAVRTAKQKRALVVVAHYWRTVRAMEEKGLDGHAPTPAELVDAGVDGFEVANRYWDDEPRDREMIRTLDALARERGLLRLSSSDEHGRWSGSPCITLLRGAFPEEPASRKDAVLEALRERRGVQPVIVMSAKTAAPVAFLLEGPVAAWRYLTSLGLGGRASWMGWILFFGWRVQVRARKREERAEGLGGPASGAGAGAG